MNDWWRLGHETVLTYVGDTVKAALVVFVGWLAIRFLIGPLRRLLERSRVDRAVASFLANSVRTAILVFIVIGVLQQFGLETASLLTLVGAVGVAVALSLQNSLANFASGLLVLSFRMVHVGDLIEVGDFRGRVSEILPFHIVLVSPDNQNITVPNTLLTTGPVRNHSTLSTRRLQWTLPLLPQDDLAAVKEALRGKLLSDLRILPEPAPRFFVQEWALDKHVLVVEGWTASGNYPAAQQDMLEPLGQTVDEARRRSPPNPAL